MMVSLTLIPWTLPGRYIDGFRRLIHPIAR
jgi:hypothetical protein